MSTTAIVAPSYIYAQIASYLHPIDDLRTLNALACTSRGAWIGVHSDMRKYLAFVRFLRPVVLDSPVLLVGATCPRSHELYSLVEDIPPCPRAAQFVVASTFDVFVHTVAALCARFGKLLNYARWAPEDCVEIQRMSTAVRDDLIGTPLPILSDVTRMLFGETWLNRMTDMNLDPVDILVFYVVMQAYMHSGSYQFQSPWEYWDTHGPECFATPTLEHGVLAYVDTLMAFVAPLSLPDGTPNDLEATYFRDTMEQFAPTEMNFEIYLMRRYEHRTDMPSTLHYYVEFINELIDGIGDDMSHIADDIPPSGWDYLMRAFDILTRVLDWAHVDGMADMLEISVCDVGNPVATSVLVYETGRLVLYPPGSAAGDGDYESGKVVVENLGPPHRMRDFLSARDFGAAHPDDLVVPQLSLMLGRMMDDITAERAWEWS